VNQPSDVRERNLRSVFAILDADRDGFIEGSDLAEMARRVCDLIGVTDGARRAAIKDGYLSWWEQLRADADQDGDGRISPAEFAAVVASGGGDPQAYYDQHASAAFRTVAEAMDHDGDGFIEQEAYCRLFEVTGMGPQAVLAGFRQLDSDGDGRLTTGQFLEGVAHLFLSQDPADPGTGMLGDA
jgi:Ca2+-binding EF-hand superfamily protein